MQDNLHRSCLICGGDIYTLKGYEVHDLVKCRKCEFVFMRRIPTLKELEEHYSVYAYESEKAIPEPTRVSLEGLLDYCEKYKKNNRMLDVGCGEGWILELAKKRGWEVYGSEFSSRAIEICERKGIKMYAGVLDPAKMKEKDFDVIISSETIEHINNPIIEFTNIYKLLRTGGLLYITTPNFNSYLRRMLKSKYHIIEYPEHLSYYTKRTLHYLLKSIGFKKVKLLTTGVSVSHYQMSTAKPGETLPNKAADEKIRQRFAKSGALRSLKGIVNKGLTVSGLGMTLKAYYTKK